MKLPTISFVELMKKMSYFTSPNEPSMIDGIWQQQKQAIFVARPDKFVLLPITEKEKEDIEFYV